jgi:hypothetical protein
MRRLMREDLSSMMLMRIQKLKIKLGWNSDSGWLRGMWAGWVAGVGCRGRSA